MDYTRARLSICGRPRTPGWKSQSKATKAGGRDLPCSHMGRKLRSVSGDPRTTQGQRKARRGHRSRGGAQPKWTTEQKSAWPNWLEATPGLLVTPVAAAVGSRAGPQLSGRNRESGGFVKLAGGHLLNGKETLGDSTSANTTPSGGRTRRPAANQDERQSSRAIMYNGQVRNGGICAGLTERCIPNAEKRSRPRSDSLPMATWSPATRRKAGQLAMSSWPPNASTENPPMSAVPAAASRAMYSPPTRISSSMGCRFDGNGRLPWTC